MKRINFISCHDLEEAIPKDQLPKGLGGHCIHCGCEDDNCQNDMWPHSNRNKVATTITVARCCAWHDLNHDVTRDMIAQTVRYKRKQAREELQN